MASPADLKAKLEAFVVEQQKALDALASQTAIEEARIKGQLLAARGVLAAWDKKVDGLVDALNAAGITIRLD